VQNTFFAIISVSSKRTYDLLPIHERCIPNEQLVAGQHVSVNIYVSGYKLLVRATYWPGVNATVSGYIYVDRHMLPGNKLLVQDTCWLYHDNIITIHLCHGRLVSLCIQQQMGNKLGTILLPIQETCWRQQDTCCRQLVAGQHVARV